MQYKSKTAVALSLKDIPKKKGLPVLFLCNFNWLAGNGECGYFCFPEGFVAYVMHQRDIVNPKSFFYLQEYYEKKRRTERRIKMFIYLIFRKLWTSYAHLACHQGKAYSLCWVLKIFSVQRCVEILVCGNHMSTWDMSYWSFAPAPSLQSSCKGSLRAMCKWSSFNSVL